MVCLANESKQAEREQHNVELEQQDTLQQETLTKLKLISQNLSVQPDSFDVFRDLWLNLKYLLGYKWNLSSIMYNTTQLLLIM